MRDSCKLADGTIVEPDDKIGKVSRLVRRCLPPTVETAVDDEGRLVLRVAGQGRQVEIMAGFSFFCSIHF